MEIGRSSSSRSSNLQQRKMASVCKLNVSLQPTGFRSGMPSFCKGRARVLRPLCGSTGTPGSSLEDPSPKNRETKLLSSLDSYFNKLQKKKASAPSEAAVEKSTSSSFVMEDSKIKSRDLQGLNALNAYFDQMQVPATKDVPKEVPKAPAEEDEKILSFLKELEGSFQQGDAKTSFAPRNASTFTNVIIGVNAAVFLFGLASPVQTPEMVEVPLPFLFGAKVNALIADGQWWRLITPMFLHDGLIHIGLGSWTLLSFGPAVESVYGPAGFCMIYLLGGVFGNITSYFHTPVPTVGGTGPLYALVAAWAVYVVQNRHSFGKEMQAGITSDVIQKLLVMSALHLALTDALPADNWTHVGATAVGALFGVLATPKAAQMNARLEDLDSKMVMSGEAPDFQRLTLAFALCVGCFFVLYSFGSPAAGEMLRVLSQNSDAEFP